MKLKLPSLVLGAAIAAEVAHAHEIYLTFDDGPIDATEGVLNVLRETKTKATFFINAFHMFGEGDENEDDALKFLKKTVKDGHIIANHSYNHMLHNCCREVDNGTKTECGAKGKCIPASSSSTKHAL